MESVLLTIAFLTVLFEAMGFWYLIRITNTVKEFVSDVSLFVFFSLGLTGLAILTVDQINHYWHLGLYPYFWTVLTVSLFVSGSVLIGIVSCFIWEFKPYAPEAIKLVTDRYSDPITIMITDSLKQMSKSKLRKVSSVYLTRWKKAYYKGIDNNYYWQVYSTANELLNK